MFKFLLQWREILADIFLIAFALMACLLFLLYWTGDGSVILFEDSLLVRVIESIIMLFALVLAIERTIADIKRITKK